MEHPDPGGGHGARRHPVLPVGELRHLPDEGGGALLLPLCVLSARGHRHGGRGGGVALDVRRVQRHFELRPHLHGAHPEEHHVAGRQALRHLVHHPDHVHHLCGPAHRAVRGRPGQRGPVPGGGRPGGRRHRSAGVLEDHSSAVKALCVGGGNPERFRDLEQLCTGCFFLTGPGET